jgi:hypothetical protein
MKRINAEILYSEIAAEGSGLYVWVYPNERSVLELQRLIEGAPFKTKNSADFHCTVIHSKQLAPDVKPMPDQVCVGTIGQINHWVDHKGRNIVVAAVDSPDLKAVHNDLAAQGLKHGFPEYNAHITLGHDIDLDARTRIWLAETNEVLAAKPLPIVFDGILRGSMTA